jgi:hypothetical protein
MHSLDYTVESGLLADSKSLKAGRTNKIIVIVAVVATMLFCFKNSTNFRVNPVQHLSTLSEAIPEISEFQLSDLTSKEAEFFKACAFSEQSNVKVLTIIQSVRESGKEPDSVYDSLISSCEDKLSQSNGHAHPWMKGVPRGEILVVQHGISSISRSKVDESTGKMFFTEMVRTNLKDPSDLSLDAPNGKMFYVESTTGSIKKVDFDGRGAVQTLVSKEPSIQAISPDLAKREMYYSCSLDSGHQLFGIKRVSMDPTDYRNGGTGETFYITDGKVNGLAVVGNYLYFTEMDAGTLKRISLDHQEKDEAELLTSSLVLPESFQVDGNDIYISNNDGKEIVFLDFSSNSPPTSFVTNTKSIHKIVLDGEGGLLWTDADGTIFKVVLSAVAGGAVTFDPSNTDIFVEVATGLENPRGFGVSLWPSSSGLRFKALNSYNRPAVHPYTEVHEEMPWVLGKIVEPARETEFVVADPLPDHKYVWEIEGDNRDKITLEGHSNALKLFKTGRHTLTLKEFSPEGDISRQLRSYAEVKYVRRELRTLYEKDRNSFLDALNTIMDIPTRQGKMIYGPLYFDITYFTDLYNRGSGEWICDHMQDGFGFLSQHLALTLYFEQSLQSIDPELAIPYWDYTIEGQEVMNKDGDFSALWDKQIFSKDWFGDANNEYHTVTEGRFAWKQIEDDCWTCVHNSYGFLRAPWNINNSPYVQRYKSLGGLSSWQLSESWPACESHHSAVKSLDTWEKFALGIAKHPYSAVKAMLGGSETKTTASETIDELFNLEDSIKLKSISHKIPHNMYRAGLLHCPDFCSDGDEDCSCSCGPEDELELQLEDPQTLDIFFTFATGGLDLETELGGHEKQKMVTAQCSATTKSGDFAESSSTSDALFWPVHPTLERLYHWRLLKKGFVDDTWANENSYKGLFYKNLNKHCYGHGSNDVMPYFVRLNDADQTWGAYYTAGQFIAASYVAGVSYSLPYVYDNYKWAHCEDHGFSFDEI